MSSTRHFSVLMICLLLLVGTAVAIWLIYATEPKAAKEGATRKSAMPVEVVAVSKAQHRPTLKAMGVVRPSKEVELKPRVSGQVIDVSDNFVPGRYLQKGDWLLQLDPTDYELALQQAEARLIEARANHTIEMGEQNRARKAFEMLGRQVSEANKALVLRQPQKMQAEARLKAAESAVQQAQVALQRTRIVMPFDGQILSRQANIGSHLSTSDMVSRLVGTASYWVEATLPLSQLPWLARYDADREPEPVLIRNPSGWAKGTFRTGYLKELVAELDDTTRMARVLVEVNDPLGLSDSQYNLASTPLIAGSYVEVELPARVVEASVKLSLDYMRKGQTVWVRNNDKLDIRPVEVVFKDGDHAYISAGLQANEEVITTNLSSVKQGAAVRLKADAVPEQANQVADQ